MGDPMGGFNLTTESIKNCIEEVLTTNVPLLLLGGGGYVPANAARLWTQLTALVVGRMRGQAGEVLQLDDDIPDEDTFFSKYGPDFQLSITPGCFKNRNDPARVKEMVNFLRDKVQR